jgi:hypothetical protein
VGIFFALRLWVKTLDHLGLDDFCDASSLSWERRCGALVSLSLIPVSSVANLVFLVFFAYL